MENGNVGGSRLGFHRGFSIWRYRRGRDRRPLDPSVLDDFGRWLARVDRAQVFGYLHLVEPHAPYDPPPPFAGLWSLGDAARIDGSLDPERGYAAAETAEDLRHIRGLYREELLFADWTFGVETRRLQARGLDDAAVIFVSDHGESMGEHGAFGHGTTAYRSETRIPLIAAGFSVSPAISRRPTSLADVAGRVLEYFGDRPTDPNPVVVTHRLKDREFVSVEDGRLRTLLTFGDPPTIQEFDVRADPGEESPRRSGATPQLRRILELVEGSRPGLNLTVEAGWEYLDIRAEPALPEVAACLGCASSLEGETLRLRPLEPAWPLVVVAFDEPPDSIRIDAHQDGRLAWTTTQSLDGPTSWQSGEPPRTTLRFDAAGPVPSAPTPEELEDLKALGYIK